MVRPGVPVHLSVPRHRRRVLCGYEALDRLCQRVVRLQRSLVGGERLLVGIHHRLKSRDLGAEVCDLPVDAIDFIVDLGHL